MWPPFTVQIPASSRPAVERFLETDLSALERLAEVIGTAQPAPDVEDLAEACAERSGISAGNIEAVLTVAINVSRLRRSMNVTATEAADAISESLPLTFGDRWSQQRANAWAERVRILETMIAEDGPIDVMSKVRDLLFDYQTVLVDTSVVTDVRHVYSASAEKMVGGLVLHNIGLRFLEAGDIREMHFTLSSPAVHALIRQLERALRKEQTATAFLEQAGLPELTPKRGRES